MSNPTSGLLARELVKTGAVSRGTAGVTAETLHTTVGARLLAAFPPSERCQIHLRVGCNIATLLLRVASFLSSQGRISAEGQVQRSPFPHVSGVIRCGLVQKIPALVHVEVVANDSGMCQLTVTAAAQEGPFPQHAAQIAAQRVVRHIHAVCEP